MPWITQVGTLLFERDRNIVEVELLAGSYFSYQIRQLRIEYLFTYSASYFVVRIWDVRPYAPVERCVKVFMGAQHNFEKV